MKIAIDAMGGDNGSKPVIEAVKEFLNKYRELEDAVKTRYKADREDDRCRHPAPWAAFRLCGLLGLLLICLLFHFASFY